MRTQLYSIYDTIAQVFNKPFTEFNDESAKRAFQQSSEKQAYINDYALYHLGEYNDNDGTIVPVSAPVRIMLGTDIKPTVSSITPEMQRADLEAVGQ